MTPKKTRRRTSRRASAATLPLPGPGERLWVLQVPFRVAAAPAEWNPQLKAHILTAAAVPGHLEPFRSRPYTYERLLEDTLNAAPAPPSHVAPMSPRPGQIEGAKGVVKSWKSGYPEFLIADDTGTGKTLTALLAVKVQAKINPTIRRVLVIADRPAQITIGHWSRSIAAIGDGGLTWCVVTWDHLAKVAKMSWDVVIADEAHMARNMTTKRWSYFQQITGLGRATRKPLLLPMTATPAHNPTELGYLSGIFAHHHQEPTQLWVKDFPGQLAAHGLHVTKKGWTEDAHERAHDVATVRRWLQPAMIARPAPWGPAPVDALPVRLDPEQWLAYQQEWGEFCSEMDLAWRGRNSSRGRAALIRFRQKAGMVRVDTTCQWVAAQVEAGRQVVVSCEYVETAAQPIHDQLEGMGISVAGIYGAGGDHEASRVAFQCGHRPVAVLTPTASLSLQACEQMADGSLATAAPRVGIFHQARWSGIQGRQVLGRTHRDHQRSPWKVAYAEGTVEEQVAKVMIERFAATSDLTGGDTSALRKVAALLRADWLPQEAVEGTG